MTWDGMYVVLNLKSMNIKLTIFLFQSQNLDCLKGETWLYKSGNGVSISTRVGGLKYVGRVSKRRPVALPLSPPSITSSSKLLGNIIIEHTALPHYTKCVIIIFQWTAHLLKQWSNPKKEDRDKTLLYNNF
jgi:hypothetical protein